MTDKLLTAIVTILIAIIGVAVLAVLLSKQSQTVGVVGASASGFRQMLCAALGPVGGCAGIPSVDSTITFGGVVQPTSLTGGL